MTNEKVLLNLLSHLLPLRNDHIFYGGKKSGSNYQASAPNLRQAFLTLTKGAFLTLTKCTPLCTQCLKQNCLAYSTELINGCIDGWLIDSESLYMYVYTQMLLYYFLIFMIELYNSIFSPKDR